VEQDFSHCVETAEKTRGFQQWKTERSTFMTQDKESFISPEERPAVGLKPDTPISELRVRDLQTILQGVTVSGIAFRDLKSTSWNWPETKNNINLKPEKWEYIKEVMSKNEKDEKHEIDIYKPNKEIKDNKDNEIPRSGGETVSPAAIDQLIQTISSLSEHVTQLTQEVQKLKQRSSGG